MFYSPSFVKKIVIVSSRKNVSVFISFICQYETIIPMKIVNMILAQK